MNMAPTVTMCFLKSGQEAVCIGQYKLVVRHSVTLYFHIHYADGNSAAKTPLTLDALTVGELMFPCS